MRARSESRRAFKFDEVRDALREYWGFTLQRGGASTDLERDGRWDTTYSKTGYIVSGYMPGYGHRHKHYRSLAAIVRGCDLTETLAKAAAKAAAR